MGTIKVVVLLIIVKIARRIVCSKKAKELATFKTTVEEATEQSVLEVDEIFSFVIIRGNQIQIWVTENATTKQIVCFFIRDGSIESCKKLWCKLPYSYLRATSFSDF